MIVTQAKLILGVIVFSLMWSFTAKSVADDSGAVVLDPEAMAEWFRSNGMPGRDDEEDDDGTDDRPEFWDMFEGGFEGGRPGGEGDFMFDREGFEGGFADIRDDLMNCLDELDIERPERPDRGDLFTALDANEDGAVDLDEATTAAVNRVTERFNSLDSNSDGQITREEVMATRQAQREEVMSRIRDTEDDSATM